MISRSIYQYYFFGTCLRYLQDAGEAFNMQITGHGGTRDNIDSFFKFLDDLDLVVTRRASRELSKFAATLPDKEGAFLSL